MSTTRVTPGLVRGAVMVAPGRELELREFPRPAELAPGEILVRVRCCTICRSDLHTWMGRRPGPVPAILGHEIVGEILELGAGVTRDSADRTLAPGDRVTWTITASCGKCFYCRVKGLPMKCRALKKYGHDCCDQPPHLRGGFAEACLLSPLTSVIKLPEELSDRVAAPANCAVATIVAGWEAAELRPCDRVLIQGAGALGCYAAAFAAFSGASRIIVTDVDQERLKLVRQFGATDCLGVAGKSDAEVAAAVADCTDGFGADSALELAGVPAIISQGLAALRIGGRYIEIGCVFPDARCDIDVSQLLTRLLTLRGVHNYETRHLLTAVDFLAATCHRFPFDQLVGESFPLTEINAALRSAEARAAVRVAVLP